jgi:hypothetical protein
MKISLSAEIHCKPEEVFPWIGEPNKAMLWQKGVKSEEIIKETPERTGTIFREVMEENGKTLEINGRIADYITNKSISFQLESKIHKVEVTYSVTGDNNKTNVAVESTINWKFPMNFFCLIMGYKIKEKITDQTMSELSELKRLCETGG